MKHLYQTKLNRKSIFQILQLITGLNYILMIDLFANDNHYKIFFFFFGQTHYKIFIRYILWKQEFYWVIRTKGYFFNSYVWISYGFQLALRLIRSGVVLKTSRSHIKSVVARTNSGSCTHSREPITTKPQTAESKKLGAII